MKQILISWSTAIDTLLHFDWNFSDQTDWGLNMSVVSSSYDKNAWGTGANIAYNLSLLWESPILLSSVGYDFEFDEVIASKVNLKYIHKERELHTANSVIVSDNTDNRMTFFHPWAMIQASESKISYVEEEIGLAIVSANNIPTMLEHARELKEKNIKIFIDPAQQISAMSAGELQELLDLWDYLIVNHKEFTELQQRASKTERDIINSVEKVVVTYGSEWSHLFTDGEMYNIPAICVDDFDDTTWAWDAYRAWLLKALIDWYDWKLWCQLGTILASYSILAPGSQHHHFSLGSVMEDLKSHYDIDIDLYKKRKY